MNTGFSTELLSEDDMNTLLKNVNISMLTDELQKKHHPGREHPFRAHNKPTGEEQLL